LAVNGHIEVLAIACADTKVDRGVGDVKYLVLLPSVRIALLPGDFIGLRIGVEDDLARGVKEPVLLRCLDYGKSSILKIPTR
jgi:hypothetical protein